MPFVTTADMLRRARQEGYAVGAFNIENMEMAQAVLSAAQAMRAPVILQTTPGTLKYADPACFAGMVRSLAEKSDIPAALHLDHGNSFELAQYCLRHGYSSVMIDGSMLPFEENIALTSRVVRIADGIPVEAELGTVGGKEDLLSASAAAYTDPAQAEEFIARTGITSFAPAIGTMHGVYRAQPHLDTALLSSIAEKTPVPLVLHGTSGVPDEVVRACIRRGISKVNYATDLRITFTQALRRSLEAAPDAFDPKEHLSAAREKVMQRVCELITLCGCAGKANI